MPSITIKEIDNTSPGVVLSAEDVVFVPGFVNPNYFGFDTTVGAYIPTLCSDVATFESYFGEIPAQFGETAEGVGQPYPNGFSSYSTEGLTKMFEKNTMDPGYIFAKELLNKGIPVIYVRCNETREEITVQHMYDILAGVTDYDIWADIKDVGEYPEVKFLTSGGYPTFEYEVLKLNIVDVGVEVNRESFNQNKFIAKVGRDSVEDKTCLFKFARLVKSVVELPEAPIAGEEDLVHYVISTEKAYKWEVSTKNNSTWVEVDIALYAFWELSINDGEFASVSPTDYGILNNAPIYGATITIVLPSVASATSVIVNKMVDVASSRGDCIALVDHTDNQNRTLNPLNKKSVFYAISNVDSSYMLKVGGEFATMFTPWCSCTFVTDLYNSYNNGTTTYTERAVTPDYMPASFLYLMAYAQSIETNANWLAVAGASRGVVNIGKPHLSSNMRLSNAIADEYQQRTGVAINPITNIKPYGYLIWGNRTLKYNAENLTATSFLNIRNMISDVKKLAYRSAKKCMFEQNSDILWINFKGMITPTLDQMVTGNGLNGYKLIQKETTEKAKLVCTIRLYPIYAVETFEITVELSDEEVTVS